MRFDVVVIGGGLAGLSCAIAVAEQGKRCAVVSSGQSALLLLRLARSAGEIAGQHAGRDAAAALPQLAQQAPQHPYALIGARPGWRRCPPPRGITAGTLRVESAGRG